MSEASRRVAFTTRGGATLDFTRLGFGAVPIGNFRRVMSADEALGVVGAAWDAGLRYFDTAPLYGHGLSEMRLGAVLREKPRADYVISTKVGRLLEPCAPGEEASGAYLGTPHVRGRYDYGYDGVMRSFEESLARLGLASVDILYVHDVDARNQGGREACEARLRELIDHGGWRALAELRATGAVKAIGIGVNEWEPCARMLELADPDLFLLAGRYTLLEQTPDRTLFPACAVRGVGIVMGGPFNSGVLARGAKGDGWYDYGAVPEEVRGRVAALEQVCLAFGVALIDAALQFVCAHPLAASTIPGAQSLAELAANNASLDRPAPAEFWATLKAKGLIDPEAPVPSAQAALC